jgi:hypothetical protein
MLTLAIVLLAGCGSYEPAVPPSPPKGEPPQAGPDAGKKGPPRAAPGPRKTEASEDEPGPAEKPRPKPEPGDAKPEQRKAEFGVGAKGHDYGPGVLTTPISVYFTIQERMAFNIKIPSAMNLFKATENRLPKSQEEFMTRIIKENDIELPALRSGDRYVYDPKTGELLVETTRASAEPRP